MVLELPEQVPARVGRESGESAGKRAKSRSQQGFWDGGRERSWQGAAGAGAGGTRLTVGDAAWAKGESCLTFYANWPTI